MKSIASTTNDSKMVIKFLYKNIFTQLGTPCGFLSDNGNYFYNNRLESLLKKYGFVDRVVLGPYFTLFLLLFDPFFLFFLC